MKAKKTSPKSIRFNKINFEKIMSSGEFESAQEMVDYLLFNYSHRENDKYVQVKPEKDLSQIISKNVTDVIDEIDFILDEKIPKERDTPHGRPFWWADQKNKIKNLIYEFRKM